MDAASTLLTSLVSAIPSTAFYVGALGIDGIPADLRWSVADGAIARQDPYYTVTGSDGLESGAR